MSVVEVIVCVLAGIGAGLGTGFAGMSAAAVISPMLIVFLDMDPYLAVGIALASDVLASAVSAYNYERKKNIDIRHGLIMMASVIVFTAISSWLASLVPDNAMGNISMLMTFFVGMKFIIKPVMTSKESMDSISPRRYLWGSIGCGAAVGCVCGFVGAGGGMMMLIILTFVLGYELKTAVGTSVFIMSFTALTGAVSHFAIGGMPDLTCLLLCAASTLLFAQIASRVAGKISTLAMNRVTGVILAALGVAMFIVDKV